VALGEAPDTGWITTYRAVAANVSPVAAAEL
jgi:hypothetical protein